MNTRGKIQPCRKSVFKKGTVREIHTNAGHRVQSGWLRFLAAKFLVCSIYRSSGTRLWRKGGGKKKKVL